LLIELLVRGASVNDCGSSGDGGHTTTTTITTTGDAPLVVCAGYNLVSTSIDFRLERWHRRRRAQH
jgi:hypothetical protein